VPGSWRHGAAVAGAGVEPEAVPSDVSDDEWAFVAPYLILCREDVPQRKHELREVFNAVRSMVKTGAQ
jgi:hypothetical protein